MRSGEVNRLIPRTLPREAPTEQAGPAPAIATAPSHKPRPRYPAQPPSQPLGPPSSSPAPNNQEGSAHLGGSSALGFCKRVTVSSQDGISVKDPHARDNASAGGDQARTNEAALLKDPVRRIPGSQLIPSAVSFGPSRPWSSSPGHPPDCCMKL